MTRKEFTNAVTELVQNYIGNFYNFDSNAQLRVNPRLLTVEIENGYAFQDDIEYSDEVIENAAYAEGDATESASDFQASQNYEYYPVHTLIAHTDGKATPDADAIRALADRYFA